MMLVIKFVIGGRAHFDFTTDFAFRYYWDTPIKLPGGTIPAVPMWSVSTLGM